MGRRLRPKSIRKFRFRCTEIAEMVIPLAACQYPWSLLLLLATLFAGANCSIKALCKPSVKKSPRRPVSRRLRARKMQKARACLALFYNEGTRLASDCLLTLCLTGCGTNKIRRCRKQVPIGRLTDACGLTLCVYHKCTAFWLLMLYHYNLCVVSSMMSAVLHSFNSLN